MEPDQITPIIVTILCLLGFSGLLICLTRKNNSFETLPAKTNQENKDGFQQEMKETRELANELSGLPKDQEDFSSFLADVFSDANIKAAVEESTGKSILEREASGAASAMKKYVDDDKAQNAIYFIHEALQEFLPDESMNLGVARIREVFKHWFENTPENLVNAANELGTELSVYNSIYQVAADDIASGQYHIYRGTLNPTGRQLHALCLQALDKIVESGTWTPEMAKEQKEVIRQEINSVG